MVVDQPHGLHEGIDRGRSHEPPAALLQCLRQGLGFGRGGSRLRRRRLFALEAPDIGRQRAGFGDQFLRPACIIDHCLDLAAVPHDAGIGQEAVDVERGETGHGVNVEIGEAGAEGFALIEDGAPAQSGLERLKAQLFEQAPVVVDGKSPFTVVIGDKFGRAGTPAAARSSIRSVYRRHHCPQAISVRRLLPQPPASPWQQSRSDDSSSLPCGGAGAHISFTSRSGLCPKCGKPARFRRLQKPRPCTSLRPLHRANPRFRPAPVAQLDRALPSEGRGREFESRRVRQ